MELHNNRHIHRKNDVIALKTNAWVLKQQSIDWFWYVFILQKKKTDIAVSSLKILIRHKIRAE